MKTINNITALLMLILSGVVFTGCNNLDEPQHLISSDDIITEEEETDNEVDVDDSGYFSWAIKVRIEDKDGNNLLDLTNPDNVIFDVEADEICHSPRNWNRHYDKANKFTLEDCLKSGLCDMFETSGPDKIFPFKDIPEGALFMTSTTTTFHFELCPGFLNGPTDEYPIYEYDLTLYIGDDWTRTYNIILETISPDSPLFLQYPFYRWIVDGEVLPNDNLTVII